MTTHRSWMLPSLVLLALGLTAAVGFQEAQDPTEVRVRMTFSELQYLDQSGEMRIVPAELLTEMRLLDQGEGQHLIELYYENGDFTRMYVPGFHIIRKGGRSREVVVSTTSVPIFPKVP